MLKSKIHDFLVGNHHNLVSSNDKMHLLYRISDAGYPKVKPKYINNENCLANAIKAFPPSKVDWHIICDNCCKETMDMIFYLMDKNA
jgi:hypothetical protein